MCGRFALTATPEEIEALFTALDLENFPARYNIAPTQPVLMIVAGPRREPGSNLPNRRSLLVRWGLIPGWAKDPKSLPLLINARSETAIEKPAFRAAMRHRRALMPASGFYEWKRDGSKKSQAYYIRPRDGRPFAFGALTETWSEPGGSEIDTGAILTTAANEGIAPIHDRMPVVIKPEDYSRWLDCISQEPRDVADLMRPIGPDFFEAIPVSDLVNKVSNTGPHVQLPVALKEGTQATEAQTDPEPPVQLSLL
ncbi:MAG: SOS response-associated peptidase [Mesorhizobium sp.]